MEKSITKEDLREVTTALTAALKVFTDRVDTLTFKTNNSNKQHRGERDDWNRVPRGENYHMGENSCSVLNMGNRLNENDIVKTDIPWVFLKISRPRW